MNFKLLPCPFCGSTNIISAPTRGFPVATECNTCGCEGPSKLTYKEADEAWNRRTPTLPEVHAAREANEEAQL